MSTRSIVVVTGQNTYGRSETIRVYKHCDGYPTGVLDVLNNAIERAIRMENEYFARFDDRRQIAPSALAGLICGEDVSMYGSGAFVEESYTEKFKPEHLGIQEDLEFIYVVDVNKRSVAVYGGDWTGKAPQVAHKKGMIDLMKYADKLREECQDDERKETMKLVQSIEAWGFSVNKTKRKKKAA